MDKLYPNKLTFGNDSAPALNSTNLNKISQALSDIDDRLIDGYTNAMQAGEILEECENYADDAGASATIATTSATNASTSASEASASASSASTSATEAEASYQRTRAIEISLGHPLIPMGTTTFENVPSLASVEVGWMYNISNDFTTTSDFEEGAGKSVSAGANIYKSTSNKWDLFASPSVVLVDETLSTTSSNPIANKTITAEVNELKKSVSDGKTLIANAITQAGGQSSATDTFSTMADGIGVVCRENYDAGVSATMKGTATTSQVMSGYTFTSSSGVNQSGALVVNSATPSNTSPKSLSSGSIYKMSSSGYAIQSYSSTSKTPTTDGVSFSSGWNRMTSSGYAYSSKPSSSDAVLLWTNSSPTSAFSAQTVSLSLSGYDYVLIEARNSTSVSYCETALVQIGSNIMWLIASTTNGLGDKSGFRPVNSVTTSGITFGGGRMNVSGTGLTDNNSYCIPTRIWGCKSVGNVPPTIGNLLWSNPSPSASAFNPQTITLSESMANYDLLKIDYKVLYSNSTAVNSHYCPTTVANYYSNKNLNPMGFSLTYEGTAYNMIRKITRTSDTQLTFTHNYYNGYASPNSSWLIPTAIYGVKFG